VRVSIDLTPSDIRQAIQMFLDKRLNFKIDIKCARISYPDQQACDPDAGIILRGLRVVDSYPDKEES